MTALWLAVAVAGGLTHRSSREPLPARWVERPVVLPAGWKQVQAQWGGALGARGRVSLGPTFELRAAGTTDPELGPASVGVAWRLGRGEAPARSAALELTWQVPELAVGPARHRVELALPVRRQWGGSRWTAAPVLDVSNLGVDARVGARGEVGLQAGPLGGLVRAQALVGSTELTSTASAGGFVQLNRAIRVELVRRFERDVVLGLELSL